VDIVIMLLLCTTAVAAYLGMGRRLVIGLWLVALVLMLGLFKYHVTSHLHLNF
jgi:hypothetical protein